MEKGSVVEFFVKGQPRLALVDSPEGKQSLRVSDSLGNSLVVAIRDLQFATTSYKISEGKTSNTTGLAGWIAKANEKAKSLDLASVWEILSADKTSSLPLEEIAGWIWSDLDGPGAYALFQTLRADKTYFKAKGDEWEVRTSDQVAEAIKQAHAAEARSKDHKALAEKIQARIADHSREIDADEAKRVEALKAFALWADEAPGKNHAVEVLGLLERSKTPEAAFALLVDMGIWSIHQNLELARTGREPGFSPAILTEAEALASLPCSTVGRLDLRSLPMITIDDESTTEIDDGLSVELKPDGTRVYWVHIADPAALIPLGSNLDLEARRRGTTVYLPEGRLTMFPSVLAEGPLSLRPGYDTAALSFSFCLAPSGELQTFDIFSSVVRSARRVTYEQAEAWLALDTVAESEPEAEIVRELGSVAALRQAWRTVAGAVSIDLPETEVHVNLVNDQVEIGLVERLKSRDLVAEMMVLAGEACARFFQQNAVPALYRSQSLGSTPVDLTALPAGPAREFAKILTMSRSVSTTEPSPHAGLGLSVYTQATSPIRRYADLCIHRQIHGFLEQKAFIFDKDAWETLAAELDPLSAQAAKLERWADRYWTIEFLKRQKARVWKGILLGWFREDDRQAQVLLVETGMRTLVKLSNTKALGETLYLKVSSADPRKDLLNFQETSHP